MCGKSPAPASLVVKSLGQQVIDFAGQFLDVELTWWQRDYIEAIYSTQGAISAGPSIPRGR